LVSFSDDIDREDEEMKLQIEEAMLLSYGRPNETSYLYDDDDEEEEE